MGTETPERGQYLVPSAGPLPERPTTAPAPPPTPSAHVDARNVSCQGLAFRVDPDVLTFHGMPITGYAEEMARRTENHVYGCDLIGHIPVVEYDELVVTRRQALVIQAPEISCMSVEMLRSIDSVRIVGGNRIHVGEDENGEPVLYRITGWDAARSALVLKRVDR